MEVKKYGQRLESFVQEKVSKLGSGTMNSTKGRDERE